MPKRLMPFLAAFMTMTMPEVMAQQPAAAVAPARPLFVQDSMNVYRRFDPKLRPAMITFYEKVLALQPLQPIQLNANMQMILFKVGTGQIKLAAEIKPDRQYHLGKVNDGTGIRMFTLAFPDEAELAARFRANGYPVPAFKDIGGGKRAALVQDPAGFTLELVADPKAAPAAHAGVEVGINVSDLERSRAFYREFVGLEELPPVRDSLLGVIKYPYRHGETVVSLWSAGRNLPADTGSAGIQYVVGNVDAIDARGKAQNIAVEQPLGDLPGFTLRTVWLNDPDGVTNYFAQIGGARSAAN